MRNLQETQRKDTDKQQLFHPVNMELDKRREREAEDDDVCCNMATI